MTLMKKSMQRKCEDDFRVGWEYLPRPEVTAHPFRIC